MTTSIKNGTASVISGISNAVCTTAMLTFGASTYVEKKLVSKLTNKTEEQIEANRIVTTFNNVDAIKRKLTKKRDLSKLGLS